MSLMISEKPDHVSDPHTTEMELPDIPATIAAQHRVQQYTDEDKVHSETADKPSDQLSIPPPPPPPPPPKAVPPPPPPPESVKGSKTDTVAPQTVHHTRNSSQERFPIYEVPVERLLLDPDCQVRAEMNEDTIEEYKEAMLAGAGFPLPVVFGSLSGELYIGDGYHRVKAARRASRSMVPIELRPGTKIDAIKYALSANLTHGLRMTNADKQRAIRLALENFGHLSNYQIARMVGVSDPSVGKYRKRLEKRAEKTIGLDGKARPSTRKKSTSPVQKSAEAPEDTTPEETPDESQDANATEPSSDHAVENIMTMIRGLTAETRETLLKLIADEYQLEARS